MADIETVARAWRFLLAARETADRGAPLPPPSGDPELWDLFGRLALTPRGAPFVIAHLGQSLDGRIATESGHSRYIGCDASIVHLHRLRALTDAVIVGVATVVADAPQLTTRRVEGPSPVRVVLDPRARLSADASVIADGRAPTIVVHARGEEPALPTEIDTIALSVEDNGMLPPRAILRALAERGLTRILVEGGGRTVSSFIAARALHRLQFAVAPLLIGSGRAALTLPAVTTLDAALRPPCRRFDLGEDSLFDFTLEGPDKDGTA